uniref:Uncharacterized protein n=1 Tax=Aegilops tauschii TaxID=37682 RepID=M8CR16_AEGTA
MAASLPDDLLLESPGSSPAAPRSALSLGRCGLTSLVTASHAGLFDRAVPLASRHHLFLLRIEDKGTSFYEDRTILWLTRCRCVPWHRTLRYHGGFHVLNMNASTYNISMWEFPNATDHFHTGYPCLTLASNGTLSLLQMRRNLPQVEIWKHYEDHENAASIKNWLCTGTIKLKQPWKVAERRQRQDLREQCGTLIISDSYGSVYTVNIETGMMKEVPDWPQRRCIFPGDAMPLEIDWPTIFVYHLSKYS